MKNNELELEKNPIKFRLGEFLKVKDLNSAQFERRCDLAEGFVSKIKGAIRTSMIQKIAEGFPELNINWLITGNGKIILEKSSVNDDSPPYGNALAKAEGKIEILERELDEAKRRLEEANKAIGRIESSCPAAHKKNNSVA